MSIRELSDAELLTKYESLKEQRKKSEAKGKNWALLIAFLASVVIGNLFRNHSWLGPIVGLVFIVTFFLVNEKIYNHLDSAIEEMESECYQEIRKREIE